jgi:hypothetical protein
MINALTILVPPAAFEVAIIFTYCTWLSWEFFRNN